MSVGAYHPIPHLTGSPSRFQQGPQSGAISGSSTLMLFRHGVTVPNSWGSSTVGHATADRIPGPLRQQGADPEERASPAGHNVAQARTPGRGRALDGRSE